MKANDLRIEELISFDEGKLGFQGRRVVLHDMHAMARFRKDLIAALGQDQARRILTRFGFYWRQASSKPRSFSRIFRQTPATCFARC